MRILSFFTVVCSGYIAKETLSLPLKVRSPVCRTTPCGGGHLWTCSRADIFGRHIRTGESMM